MAQGDSKLAREYPLQAGKGEYNNSTDTFKLYFCSDTYAAIDIDTAPLNLSDVTQVGGGNVPIGGVTLTGTTWARSGAVCTLDFNNIATITKNASNPATIRTAVIVNDTSTSDDIYKVVDLTTDGTTPIDLVTNDFDYSFNAGGSQTATVT